MFQAAKKQNGDTFFLISRIGRNTVRLWRMIAEEHTILLGGLTGLFVILAVIPYVQSASRGVLIDELIRRFGNGMIGNRLILAGAIFIVSSAGMVFLSTVQDYLLRLLGYIAKEKLELATIQKRGEADIASHEDPKMSDLFTKVAEQGVWRAEQFFQRQFYFFQNIFEILIGAAVVAAYGPWPFMIVVICTAPELAVQMRHGHGAWNIWNAKAETRRRFGEMRMHFYWLPWITELKIFQNVGHFATIIRDILVAFRKEETKNERKRMLWALGANTLSQAGFAYAIVSFLLQAVRGGLEIGTFTFVVASLVALRVALSSFFMNLGKQFEDGLFVSDLFAMLEIPAAIPKPVQGFFLHPACTPEIIFENVSFTYPGMQKSALSHISLVIPQGEKLALVGGNGSGKTTFVKLLCRFYDPTEGRILIDGRDLRTINLESWYAMLGVLFQEYAHYHLLVKDVITLGRSGYEPTLEKIKAAAQASEADAFIEEWERQYEQMLGKSFWQGVEPSIGQWQKLALARTFYRDPRVLILDEPTSSVDAEGEAHIFERIESAGRERTVILVSHRFSTVRHADRIAVLERGILTELGAHEKLLAHGGMYARLFKLQAKGYQ